ncbi:MAG: GNAT family N-acetyltransferase [Candidatus Kariarchaeaceae archaeon]|jgi:ribosomal protein S18 acetylase RimI-like enzyme
MSQIEQLSIDDYNKIKHLWESSEIPYKPLGRDSYDFLKNRLETSPTWLLGIRSNENLLIGVVIVSHDGQRGWINRLAVHASHRRKGFALQLIKAAEELLTEQGIRLWTALIEDYNTISQTLFQKAGYHKHDDVIYFSKRDSKDY